MLALALVEAEECSSCGGWLVETTAPDAFDVYVVDAPHRCHRCTGIAEARDRFKDSPHPSALRFPVRDRRLG